MFSDPDRTIYMQQIDGYDELTAIPVKEFMERSLLMGGRVYVNEDTDLTIVPWLEENGLAPTEVVQLPGKCMFTTLSSNGPEMQALKKRLQDGAKLQFFHTTDLEASFLQSTDLDWSSTLSCSPQIADKMGDKAYLRRLANEVDCPSAFPRHTILTSVWNKDDFDWAIRITQPEEPGRWNVLVKPTTLAGGEGICRVGSTQFLSFAERFRGREVIVEKEIMQRESLSIQWFIRSGDPKLIGTCLQWHDGFVHQGEVLSSHFDVVNEESANKLRQLTKPFVRHAVRLGYNGVLAFSTVLDKQTGKIYLLGADARVTSATYCYAIAHRLGMHEWAIANKVIEPSKWIETWNMARGNLGNSLLFRRRRGDGVIPYMIGALKRSNLRRMGLMAVARNSKTAISLLAEAEKRLTA